MPQKPEYKERLERILRRARRWYRARHAMHDGLVMAIVAASGAFVLMLLAGLGFVDTAVWTVGAPAAAGLVLGGLLVGAVRPLNDQVVLAGLDRDHGLQNALSTTRELVLGGGRLTELAHCHVRQSLTRAERLGLARTMTADLGGHARILGVLCLCIASVALI